MRAQAAGPASTSWSAAFMSLEHGANDALSRLEAETITILREAYRASSKPCMLWSIGKDSTALLWMARKAFLGRVPFPMVLLETFMELPEVYEFQDRLIAE